MSRPRLSLALGLAALLLALGTVTQALAGQSAHAFIGAEKCKLCHKSEKVGAQFAKWTESRHAQAYATLGSDEAKKIAAEKGLGDPQKEGACLKCHVTGHGAPAEQLTEKYAAEEGVGCESCHGAGGDYWKRTVMKDKEASIAAGMQIPDEKTCKGCHNAESPTFKSFDYKEYLEKIAHPRPSA